MPSVHHRHFDHLGHCAQTLTLSQRNWKTKRLQDCVQPFEPWEESCALGCWVNATKSCHVRTHTPFKNSCHTGSNYPLCV